ncbi:hypothetical protein B0H16DRAFT_1709613 [Mycena metata]|uniref:DUF6533 domain-containing protein n=1 Tax=Mycena metata TaxID=1033252 RepID=A0AAD7KDX1_9AGAR|nr:hypothetical protein B0H16DRAFT_1709613 [Mycena metata]
MQNGPDVPDIAKAYATQVVYASSVGALAFLAYDIIITLDDEIRLVWPKPWGRMKFLFLFIRYIPLFVQISIVVLGCPELTPQFNFTSHDCFIWQVYQGVASVLIIVAVDYVLILRVSALYHDKPTIRRVVLAAFGLEFAGMCVGLGLSLPGIQFDDLCVVTSVSTTLLIYGGASISFQTFLFSLTAIKFARAVREGWGDTPLLALVMRDGTWAFLLIFAFVAAYASLYALKNHTFAGTLYGWILSVFSFAGYHVLLNLENHNYGPRLPTGRTSRTLTDDSFRFSTRVITEPTNNDLSMLDDLPG